MSNRLRSLDSKISFFAFADIITAVSGVLIFVALLLATDIGVPTVSTSSPESKAEAQIENLLAQQVLIDAQNCKIRWLQQTLLQEKGSSRPMSVGRKSNRSQQIKSWSRSPGR